MIQAGKDALDRFGAGTASVRFICGTFTVHRELERELADFVGTDSSLSYVSCWNANEGLFAALAGPDDIVISDRLNHASIIDAMRLAKAGEKIMALDGKEYELDENMTCIADAKGVHGIAGVMGGEVTGCTGDTTEQGHYCR